MAVAVQPMHSSHRLSFIPIAHSRATTSTASQQQPVAWQQQQEQELPEDQFTTLFCRALYDYDAQDASALSFRRNDIIEVLSQEPSGWWDGLLGDERGWFPSNYVDIISEEELGLLGADLSNGDSRESIMGRQSAMVDMSIMRGTNQAENEEWLSAEMSFRADPLNASDALADGSVQSNDFWMPRITPDAQIYYVNTRTGQQSRDLPQEADEEISDSDLAGLTSQSTSRSGISASLAFGPKGTSDPFANSHSIAGFGISRRTGTPEPWIRKLADDGMSYYYHNKLDGQVQWTRPEAHITQDITVSHRPPSLSQPTREINGNRDSVYSDDSDVQPLDIIRPLDPQLSNGQSLEPGEPSRSIQGDSSAVDVDFTSAERIARSLQQALSPPPPELITELSAIAKVAIQEVVKNIQLNGLARRPDEDQRMDELLYEVVLSVRNLLYTSAVPTAQIPADVLPLEVRDTATSSIPATLKSSHRKVTATLSRLVLSARAIQYDSGSLITDTLSRIEVDAEELERAVLSFVLEVQRTHHTELPEGKPLKRLQGVFSPTNLGLGLIGAGAAGRWKGFGWVRLDQAAPDEPRKVFNHEVISDMKSQLASIDDQFKNLVRALQTSDENAVEQLRLHGREVVARVSSFLTFAGDIHVARHVDIDGIGQEDTASSTDYMHTVDNARLLVRTLEAVFQSIYDDCSILLLTIQSVRDSDTGHEKSHTHEYLDALSTPLGSNLRLLVQTLDSLLSVGHDQAEMALGEYTGSIDWRMSRVSMRPIAELSDIYGADASDVVDTKVSKGGSSYEPYTRHFSGGPDAPNRSLDLTEETLVELDRSDVPRNNSSPLFEDDLLPNKTPPRGGTAGSKKLAKLLGAEYEEQVAAADLRPWYLRSNFNPSEIVIDTDHSVKGGTLPALVERLTAHEPPDTNYIAYTKAFLMTYKSFTTVDELFDLLVERFRIQPPANMTPSERDNWGKHKQHIIQTRVLNTFKAMVGDEDVLEKDDLHILNRMKAFVASEEVARFGAAKPLSAQIERAQKGGDATVKTTTNQGPPPPPIMPRANKRLKLTDIEPLELARQLTIMESNLYQKIRPLECLQRAREQKTETMDNIAIVIQTSNRIADWVAESVLSKEDSRKRANIVKHLISVADRCRTMNNFSTMIAITSGLNTPPIRRLKRTWEQVNQRCMAQFGACEMTIDSSKTYAKYSQLMASVNPPCVPFIGVFLSTLQFIQDGNPDILLGGLINFQKRQMASKVIDDIKRWQAATYNLQPIPAIQTWIEESLNQFNDTRASSEHFWTLSLEREPREREDEKMARLLQESGFL